MERLEHRSAVPEDHVSEARVLAGAHALEVRRLADRVDAEQQPLHQHVPPPESRVPREPEHLAARRHRVRGHHPAGLHELRAIRHQRMGGARRLRSSRRAAAEPSRHHLPAQVHRAARRIEVGFLDLPEDLRAARARGLLHGRRRRARLGETAIRWLGSAEVHLVEGVRSQGLLRGPDGERGAARAALVELVLRGPQEGRAGADAATVGLFAGVPEGSANADRQDRVRLRELEALRSVERRTGRRSRSTSVRRSSRAARASKTFRCSSSRRIRGSRSTRRWTARTAS